ncbi:MAG: hypothetical protein KC586_27025, partial [Myxococcales bacterium]|nr:hypothetical protein [Myxococcales bacterium]
IRSKRAAERVVLEDTSGPSVMVLRPPALYGPGEHRLVPLFRAALRGVVPTVHPDGTLSILSGHDCAEAIARVIEVEPEARTLFLAEPKPYGRRQMAELVGEAVGKRVTVLPIPVPVLRAAAFGSELAGRLRDQPVAFTRDKVRDLAAPHQSCDPSRAMEELFWAPRDDFASGAKTMVQAYRAKGWL